MVEITNLHVEKKLTVAEIFDCDNTCILENGKIAFCAWMDVFLFEKVEKKDYFLCFTIDPDGKTNIEYIRTNALATPCDVQITVD